MRQKVFRPFTLDVDGPPPPNHQGEFSIDKKTDRVFYVKPDNVVGGLSQIFGSDKWLTLRYLLSDFGVADFFASVTLPTQFVIRYVATHKKMYDDTTVYYGYSIIAALPRIFLDKTQETEYVQNEAFRHGNVLVNWKPMQAELVDFNSLFQARCGTIAIEVSPNIGEENMNMRLAMEAVKDLGGGADTPNRRGLLDQYKSNPGGLFDSLYPVWKKREAIIRSTIPVKAAVETADVDVDVQQQLADDFKQKAEISAPILSKQQLQTETAAAADGGRSRKSVHSTARTPEEEPRESKNVKSPRSKANARNTGNRRSRTRSDRTSTYSSALFETTILNHGSTHNPVEILKRQPAEVQQPGKENVPAVSPGIEKCGAIDGGGGDSRHKDYGRYFYPGTNARMSDSRIVHSSIYRVFNRRPRASSVNSSDYNVLLVGPTGSGKSTLINSIVNYFRYETLSDALDGELLTILPCQFDLQDNDYNFQTISWGRDENERFNTVGQAVTHLPRVHQLYRGAMTLNLIDTPGLCDSRGVDQDEKTLEAIREAVRRAGTLHAICFVLLPNEAKMGAGLELVFRKLLSLFSVDAFPNVCFFFTNSCGTLFRPGDSIQPIRHLQATMKEELGADLPFGKDNVFCVDSDAFRYRVVKKADPDLAKGDSAFLENNWVTSRAAVMQFMHFVRRRQPVVVGPHL